MSPEPSSRLQPSASYSITMRLHLPQRPDSFAVVAHAIADAGAMLGAVDIVRVAASEIVRDVTVACTDSAHADMVVRAVSSVDGVTVATVSDRTFLMHKGGKIEVIPKAPITTRDDLSMAYTPGVARVSLGSTGTTVRPFDTEKGTVMSRCQSGLLTGVAVSRITPSPAPRAGSFRSMIIQELS